jgi:hypothetical protein
MPLGSSVRLLTLCNDLIQVNTSQSIFVKIIIENIETHFGEEDF